MTTVLVVDDADDTRAVLTTLLGRRGYRVLEARAGREALDLAERDVPDLVVSDVLMPGMDGYALARALRADPRTARAELVFYTANYTEPELRAQMSACGVRQVVRKGTDPRRLLRAVDEALSGPPAAVDDEPANADRVHAGIVNTKLVEKMRELDATEARFRTMAECSPAGIVLVGADGQASYANERLAAITGIERGALLGSGWQRCLPADRRADVLAALAGGAEGLDHHYRIRHVDAWGRARWLDVHLRVTAGGPAAGAVGTVDDVTAFVEAEERVLAETRRREVAERVRVAERLGSLRTLAGGVAHDYNNLLAVILSFTGFVQDALTDERDAGRLGAAVADDALHDLDRVAEAARRATGLSRRLQQFGNGEPGRPGPVRLDDVVAAEAGLVRDLAGPAVEVRIAADPRTPAARGDEQQIQDVLRALVSNALAAMPAGGELTIETAGLDLQRDAATDELPPGHYARLTVRDTGFGMSAEVLAHAIEPFFTTRRRGEGAGLGLAAAYGIATRLGGDLRLASRPGVGTSVDLVLPTVDAAEPAPVAGPGRARPGGAGEIIVVDDEPAVAELAARILTAHDHRCRVAGGGEEALRLLASAADDVALVVTDLVMPHMSGIELRRRIAAAHPDLPVVFMSGFADPALDAGERRPGPDTPVVRKPFAAGDLVQAVRSALAAAGG